MSEVCQETKKFSVIAQLVLSFVSYLVCQNHISLAVVLLFQTTFSLLIGVNVLLNL